MINYESFNGAYFNLPCEIMSSIATYLETRDITHLVETKKNIISDDVYQQNFDRHVFLQLYYNCLETNEQSFHLLSAMIRSNRFIMFSRSVSYKVIIELASYAYDNKIVDKMICSLVKCMLQNQRWKINNNDRIQLLLGIEFEDEEMNTIIKELLNMGLIDALSQEELKDAIISYLNDNFDNWDLYDVFLSRLNPKKLTNNLFWNYGLWVVMQMKMIRLILISNIVISGLVIILVNLISQ